jgi:uncharacterized membrane protein
MPKKKVTKKSVKKSSKKSNKKVTNKKTAKSFNKKQSSSPSLLGAFIATFFSLIGAVISLLIWHKNEYVVFYAKQSLILFLIALVLSIFSGLVLWIPIIGWAIGAALQIFVIILWVLTWIYSLSGEKREIPFIRIFMK